jgi:hypothetical protein
MQISFDLYGNCCNEYPLITIKNNQEVLYHGYVQDRQVLIFDIDTLVDHTLTLTGLNKCNGTDGKWDTAIDDQGRIIKDKNLRINDIQIENISMGIEWIKNLPMHKQNNIIEPCLMGMYANGSIQFRITLPVIDWIIKEKFIKQEKKLAFESHARSGQRKFEYEYVQEKIQSIRQILNDQNVNL